MCTESLMMVVASLVPNFLMGIITGARIIVMRYTQMLDKLPLLFPIMYILPSVSSIKWLCMQSILMMTSGFFLLLPDLPRPFGIRPLQVVGLGCYSHLVFDITGAFVCVDRDLWPLKKRH
ncbi:hypothetical protein C1H46_009072 [Malus baccata]|uniref:Uncharacterized protein n=1 Tax=Malus baccata TaxID=106549 RepID=A0A540N2K6_MALBA|nr:hypothetical protein C1H46_009072 [Malus baccata]